jgi:hypothetical protein
MLGDCAWAEIMYLTARASGVRPVRRRNSDGFSEILNRRFSSNQKQIAVISDIRISAVSMFTRRNSHP